jgi:hypothetical protein
VTRGWNSAVSTPRDHSTTLRNPRARSSAASAGVAAITAWLGPWNQRRIRQTQASGIGERAWKLVVKGTPCLRQ